jgi:hypothetical protein
MPCFPAFLIGQSVRKQAGAGGLFTLALPPLVWLLVLRVRRRRGRRGKALVEDLTA